MVILPPLLEVAPRMLIAHKVEILRIFTGHELTFRSERLNAELGPGTCLPLSGTELGGTPTFHAAVQLRTWLWGNRVKGCGEVDARRESRNPQYTFAVDIPALRTTVGW